MALAPIQFSGASLVPDIAGGIQRGQQILQGENVLAQQSLGLQQQEQAAQQREKGKELIRRQKSGEQIQTGAELAELFVDNPELAQNVLRSAGIENEFQKNDFAEFGFKLEQSGGNHELQQQLIQQRIQEVTARGGDPKDTTALLSAPPDRIAQFARTAQLAALSPQERMEIAKGGKQGMASAVTKIYKNGTSVQALPNQEVVVKDPMERVVVGPERARVLREALEAEEASAKRLADIDVRKAQQVAQATQREKRVSDVKTELSTRNRNAKRESVRLNQALKVASTADQGLTGTVKLQLAKVLPNIDVADEAVLDQTLKQLAVDQLQSFKGPTTDFEFGIVEQTTGSIGDPRSANVARLKSLQRANWFNQREFDQFNRHVNNGGDPDTFAFNFGEPIDTKKGVFTLQDIQDTAVAQNLSIDEVLKRLNK